LPESGIPAMPHVVFLKNLVDAETLTDGVRALIGREPNALFPRKLNRSTLDVPRHNSITNGD
jgi:hypothetical protein